MAVYFLQRHSAAWVRGDCVPPLLFTLTGCRPPHVTSLLLDGICLVIPALFSGLQKSELIGQQRVAYERCLMC